MAREMKNSGIEWIGQIPEEWNITKIKFLCEMQSGDNITAQDINLEKDEINCYEVYGANGFRGYYKDYTHKGKYCLIGRQGALAGNVHITNSTFWATDHAVVVYVNNKISQEYMYYLLISMNLNQYAFETAAQPGLSVSKIMNLQVVCPSYMQQQIILEYLNKKCAEIDSLSSDIQSQISILEDYKKSVITEAVTKGLNPDVEMKDSGIEWIGEIPKEWNKIKIKYATNEIKKGISPNYTENEHTKIINQATFSKGFFDIENIRYANDDFYTSKGQVKKNDVLLATTGGGVLGKTYYFNEDGEFLASTDVAYVRVNINKLVAKFLYYCLSINYVMFNDIMANGSTNQTHFDMPSLFNMFLPLPNIETQNIIVDYLDKKSAEIDAIITEKREQLGVLEQYKKSIIYEYVTGKKEVPDNNG